MTPSVLVLAAPGSNRDRDAARAFELAGARATIATMAAVSARPEALSDAAVVVLPGGFSYGDDLGAGRVWALELALGTPVGDALRAHLARGRMVLGICNGFQALAKAGLLGRVTLARNASGSFECRWVTLAPSAASPSPVVRALAAAGAVVRCPVAHGEGRVVFADPAARAAAHAAFRYVGEGYPHNPNGSEDGVAGLTDPSGLVLGLMPHAEDAVLASHDPARREASGLALFEAVVSYAKAA